MKKRVLIVLIGCGILFGGIFIYKGIISLIIKHSLATYQAPVVPVSTMKVPKTLWQPKLSASGSLRSINGINVTTELAGMVQKIYFTPGAFVKKDAVLVQLNADTEIGQLQSYQAQAALAKITYERDQSQYQVQAVSKQTLDADFQNLKSLGGQVIQQTATVAKKTIRAPFSGRLGINNVYLGQYLNPGDAVVSLQTLDPIYVDFFMPQQTLSHIKVGQSVIISTNSYPGKIFKGKITTINPAIDTNTRNVEVEATLPNPKLQLTPGMFAAVTIDIGTSQRYLTLPQTAITYNPYGDVVYIVHQTSKDNKGNPILIANQTFVTTGETRGDQVTILKGLKEGDIVVTSGQLKLKNGAHISINNKVVPTNNPAPKAPNEEY